MKDAMKAFRDLVRILLGPDACADAKTSFGNELCILGIDVSVSSRGYRFAPADAKVLKWVAQIQAILESPRSVLLPGDASKLAGQLSWACTNAFRAFGRAMLRPLFDQVEIRWKNLTRTQTSALLVGRCPATRHR